ncbi:hypothetical protein CS060_11635, partial [Anoxybacillus flavithermus]
GIKGLEAFCLPSHCRTRENTKTTNQAIRQIRMIQRIKGNKKAEGADQKRECVLGSAPFE